MEKRRKQANHRDRELSKPRNDKRTASGVLVHRVKRPYEPPKVESLIFTLGFCVGIEIGMFLIMLAMTYMATH